MDAPGTTSRGVLGIGLAALLGKALVVRLPWTALLLQLAELHADGLKAGARGSGMVDHLGEIAIFYWMGTSLWVYIMPLLLDFVGCFVYFCPLFDIPVLCILLWAVLWGLQVPVWLRIFTTHVPLVVQILFWLFSLAYPLVLRLAFGAAQAQSLPSGRLLELYRKLSSPMSRLGNEALVGTLSMCCLEWVLFIAYVATRTTEFLHAWPFSLAFSTVLLCNDTLGVVFGRLWFVRRSRQPCWKLSYQGFHARGADYAGDNADEVCGVCLETLCAPVADVAAYSYAQRRRAPGLAACRLRGGSGLAAARSRPLDEPHPHGRCPSTWRTATLPCGHQFHALCMQQCASAIARRRACPMCRAEYAAADATEEIEEILLEDDVLLDYSQPFALGFCVLAVFLLASIFPGTRPSSFLGSASVSLIIVVASFGLASFGYLDFVDVADDDSLEDVDMGGMAVF